MQCPHCAAVVTDPMGACQACGRVPAQADEPGKSPRIEPPFQDPPEVAAPSPVVQELYKAAVGSRSQDYYLRQFARFDLAGKTGVTWHWPAFLSTLNWLAWRGMWSAALLFATLCLGLGLLVFGIGRLVFDFSATSELALLAGCLALVFVLPGLFGNALYYRFTKRRVEAALAGAATVDEACESLAAQAGSNRRWYVLAATNSSLLVVIGVFAWLLTSSASIEPASASAPTAPTAPIATHLVTAAAAPASLPAESVNMAPAPSVTPAPEILRVSQAQAATSPPAAPAATRAQQSGPIGKEPAAPAPTAPASAATPAEFRFALQVGAFAKEDNARKAQAKLQAAGFKTYTEVLDTSQGKRIRVRVGPFATRAEAEQAAPRIKELELPALLVKT